MVRLVWSKLINPQICLVCGKESGTGYPLCSGCLESRFLQPSSQISFVHPDPQRCLTCGRPLVSAMEVCTVCRNLPILTAIDRIIPLFSYTGIGQELLTRWKITGMRGLSWPFARCLAEALESISRKGLESIVIIPVPPRPGKIREKGWDQVDELAGILSRKFGISILRCLSRDGGLEQKKLGRLDRYNNLKGHMQIRKGISVPETVIVLDDLMTTGSTLDSCAEVLKNAGAGKVYGLTLFFD